MGKPVERELTIKIRFHFVRVKGPDKRQGAHRLLDAAIRRVLRGVPQIVVDDIEMERTLN